MEKAKLWFNRVVNSNAGKYIAEIAILVGHK
jgi:hypothetical protein